MALASEFRNSLRSYFLKAFDILRGEHSAPAGRLLILSVYGIKVIADSSDARSVVRKAAESAWDYLVRHHSDTGEALAQATARVLKGTITDPKDPHIGDHGVFAAKYITPLFETKPGGTDHSITKLIRFAQQLPPFSNEEQRKDFIATLIEETLDSSSRDARSNDHSLYSSTSMLGEVIGILAQHFINKVPETAYDPAIGTGKTLLHAVSPFAQNSNSHRPAVYGQDINQAVLISASWRLLLNGISEINLSPGDVLTEPAFSDNDKHVERFDLVTSVPPPGLHVSRRSDLARMEVDPSNRFQYGPIPRNSADWLFVEHALASTSPDGVAIISLPPGALSRSGAEADIRRGLITADHVSAVLLLPSGLIPGTSMQAALVVLEVQKPLKRQGNTLFIDLTDSAHEEITNTLQNELAPDNPQGRNIVVTTDELREKDYVLLPTPYLPPRDVRSTLMTRETALKQLENALSDLNEAASQFQRHTRANQ